MGYREDDEAVLRKRDELARRLAAGDASVRIEIDAIDAARMRAARARIPGIAQASLASPCGERWDTMLGDGAVRTCSRCENEVFDLSQLTLGRAEALIASHRSGVCARLHRRTDGTMMFADCEVGARGVMKRRLVVVGAVVIASSAAIAWAERPPPPPQAATPIPAPASRAALREAGDAFLHGPPEPVVDMRELVPVSAADRRLAGR